MLWVGPQWRRNSLAEEHIDDEIAFLRDLSLQEIRGAQAKLNHLANLAMAYRLVPRLASVPEETRQRKEAWRRKSLSVNTRESRREDDG